jgi:uncharacterized protein (DUF1697 family)
MALVVLIKGINVGGHRTFRPSLLAQQLKRFDVINIGAAGTFVVRRSISRVELRAEIERRLPFQADVMICSGNDVLGLVSGDPFAGQASRRDVVQFVSVMKRNRKLTFPLPLTLPAKGQWCLKVLAYYDRFVLGLHRREMKAISYLGKLEEAVGVPLATRSWKTILAIGRQLEA